MRRSLTILAAVACTGVAPAQVGFECAPLGPLPGDPAANCEGVASDSQVASTGVTTPRRAASRRGLAVLCS